MNYYNQLFPPIIDSKMDAYDYSQSVKVYFQISVVNTRSQIQHAQVIINRVDTNVNALSTVTYPLGIIFKYNNDILYDTTSKLYYITLPAALLTANVYYKLQIRFGEQDLTQVSNINYVWLNTASEIAKFSEWSTVCIIKPITPPTFGLIGFSSIDGNGDLIEPVYDLNTSTFVNIVNTSSFNFIGTYSMNDSTREESLKSYRFQIYKYVEGLDKSTWTLLDDSGVKYIGQYEQQTIQFIPSILLERTKNYYIDFTITSNNGYTKTLTFKILVMYQRVSFYNALLLNPDNDNAKINLTITAKRILLLPQGDTTVTYISNGVNVPSDVTYTHAVIDGQVKENTNFDFYTIDGKFAIQLKAMGITPQINQVNSYNNPFFQISYVKSSKDLKPQMYYYNLKLSTLKQKISFDTDASERWNNYFIVFKELWKYGETKPSLTQKYLYKFSADNGDMTGYEFINPNNEYYFYLEEDNGIMYFTVEKVRTIS